MEATRCQGTNREGGPCGAQHYEGGWCRWHHPDLAEARREWSTKGGRARSNVNRARKAAPLDAMDTDTIRGVLGQVAKRLLDGSMDPGVAQAVSSVCRVALAANQQLALADMADQLAEIESRTAS